MNILNQTQLRELYEMEATGINTAYGASEKLGALALSDAITSFTDFLTLQEGRFIPGMNINYRIFIVGLLENIDNKYLEAATAEIMFPDKLDNSSLPTGKAMKIIK